MDALFPGFLPQCCDAVGYLELGARCATEGRCWDALRPLGMTVYASLPHRLGLPPQSLVYFNIVLVAASALLAARFLRALWPAGGVVPMVGRTIIAFVPYGTFLWAPCFNSLSDGPAAALFLGGLWLACIGICERRGVAAAAFAGLLLGLSAFVRLAYLYPVLATGGAYAFLAAWGTRIRPRNAAALLLAMLLPMGVQVQRTHAHTGAWSYIDVSASAALMSLHTGSTFYGYDTLVPTWTAPGKPPLAPEDAVLVQQGAGLGYEGRGCFTRERPEGIVPALQHGALAGALCLAMKREEFYFASYAPFGVVYLPSPGARLWSHWFLAIWLVVIASALSWLWRNREIGVLTFVAIGAIDAVSVISVPEQRFLASVHVFLGVVALSVLASAVVSWQAKRSAVSSM